MRVPGVVYAHATGTLVGDAAESKAIDAVYDGNQPSRRSRSSRTQHGERWRDVRHRRIMGNARREDSADDGASGSFVNVSIVMERPRALSYSSFQVNAFGFGGQNASLVISR